jgi:hypothetical protein
LTAKGRKALQARSSTWQTYAECVADVLGLKKADAKLDAIR